MIVSELVLCILFRNVRTQKKKKNMEYSPTNGIVYLVHIPFAHLEAVCIFIGFQ